MTLAFDVNYILSYCEFSLTHLNDPVKKCYYLEGHLRSIWLTCQ